jgi:hypothetical protein
LGLVAGTFQETVLFDGLLLGGLGRHAGTNAAGHG